MEMRMELKLTTQVSSTSKMYSDKRSMLRKQLLRAQLSIMECRCLKLQCKVLKGILCKKRMKEFRCSNCPLEEDNKDLPT
jgi:hypothetical protein